MSRRVVFTVGWCDRRVNGPGMMRCWSVRYVAVLLRVVRATVSGSGVWPDVLAWGYGCGRERVARLMRQETLQASATPAKGPFAP